MMSGDMEALTSSVAIISASDSDCPAQMAVLCFTECFQASSDFWKTQRARFRFLDRL